MLLVNHISSFFFFCYGKKLLSGYEFVIFFLSSHITPNILCCLVELLSSAQKRDQVSKQRIIRKTEEMIG